MAEEKRVLIVGGVAGGASTAARLGASVRTHKSSCSSGASHISFANCGLPYHIGNVIKEKDRLLVQTPEQMKSASGSTCGSARRCCASTGSRRPSRSAIWRATANTPSRTMCWSSVPGPSPFAPHSRRRQIGRVFTLRSIADMDAIKRLVDEEKPARAVVIGGGYIGLEMAEALVERGLQVSLVELEPQVMSTVDPEMAFPLHQELRSHGVELLLGASVTGIQERGPDTLEVQLSDGQMRQAGLVVMSVGVRPEAKLAREAGLRIGNRGGIVVNSHMQTSDPSIYAVGDAVEVADFVGGHPTLIPLAGPANRQGRVAADNICGRDSTYHSTQGTAICKVFALAAATTGLNEKSLKRMGRRYEKVYIHPAHHAGYYPGASQISLKLLFDPQDGKILGAQAVGTSGVDKRIDIIAVAMRAGMTVQQLQDVELCYAPPFGSAKDPVNYAGFVASNVISGDMPICHVEDVVNPSADRMLLDVRSPTEVKAGTIPGAVNIPVDELRNRLDELPRDKEVLVFCQVGLRGYLAGRILSQAGFRCRNLTGGYKTYCAAQAVRPKAAASAPGVKSDTKA